MRFRIDDKKLLSVYQNVRFSGGYPQDAVKAFRKRVQFIAAAGNETEFYAMKSFHYEKLKGNRSHQRSIRLNDQYRLILEIEQDKAGNVIAIISIEDYH